MKRFEEEIDTLRNTKSELEVRVTELLTEKKKGESKIEELKGRFECHRSCLIINGYLWL